MSDKQKKEVESRETEPKTGMKKPARKKPVKKKKGKKSGKGFIILFIVIVILLIGAGSAFVLLNQNKEVPVPDTVETMVTAYWQVWYRVECPWKKRITSVRRKRC